MTNRYQNLELHELLKRVASYSSFDMAYDYIIDEEVIYNPLIIKRNINYTNDAFKYLNNNSRLTFEDVKDISDLLEAIKRGYILKLSEVNEVLNHNIQIRRIYNTLKESFKDSDLNDFIVSLFYSDKLIELIKSYVTDTNEIKENATPKLKELFTKKRELEADINNKAQNFIRSNTNNLQEAVVYQRDGRVCFLVKNTNKNKYDGYSHGSSASGQAAYIEPKLFVDLNNRLNEIKSDINEEINIILRSLSHEISKYLEQFKNNLESLMYLDVILAKATFGLDNGGTMASIDSENLILKNIAHPLIDKEKVVKNNYNIIKPINGIVITGSNTGGKTVSLKVIALSVLMTYLGIPVLADEASIPLFDMVYDDIDDNQSIVDSLSTFSSRLVSLNNILNNITSKSLVLIDEIASGTDPKEGEALALAIIDRMIDVRCNFIITTHFNKIKEYALDNPNILLASQEFDIQKLLPTYRYIENSFGTSNALDIAIRYLDDKSLISKAREYLALNQSEEERNLKAIEAKQEELKLKEKDLEEAIALNEELKAKLDKEYQEFNLQKEELFNKAKAKANHYLDRQKEKIRAIAKKVNEFNVGANIKEVEKELEDIGSNYIEDTKEVKDLNVNDYVKILSTSQIGIIEEIKKDRVTVNVHGIIIKTSLDNLEASEAPVAQKKKHVDKSYKRVSSEVLLVGMRKEEAMEVLSKYLDEAYGSNLKQVKIIHGAGTGALRSAVSEYLKKQSFIKNYHFGDAYEGGSNVTIVEFK